jgi:hypothetical protein
MLQEWFLKLWLVEARLPAGLQLRHCIGHHNSEEGDDEQRLHIELVGWLLCALL